jgi:putative endonuclease
MNLAKKAGPSTSDRIIIHTEKFNSKSEAMKREKQLKSARGREWIWEKIRDEFK